MCGRVSFIHVTEEGLGDSISAWQKYKTTISKAKLRIDKYHVAEENSTWPVKISAHLEPVNKRPCKQSGLKSSTKMYKVQPDDSQDIWVHLFSTGPGSNTGKYFKRQNILKDSLDTVQS